ncbi:MAG: hypothetical protein IJS09_03040 [Treponema sp.]|nr:hypothetical protein [Treponema sp.]
MKKRNLVWVASLICAVTLLFSCASAPEPVAVDPLSLIARDAALYMYIPVQSHLDLVTSSLSSMTGMSEKDAERIASRTEVIYIASENTKRRQLFQLSAKGKYPLKFVKKALNKPDSGWLLQMTDSLRLPYDYYKNPQFQIQLALPSSSNALVSTEVTPQLAQYDDAVVSSADALIEATAPQGIPAGFDKNAYEFLTTGNPNEIRFYECKADAFLQDMLNTTLKLPLKSVSGTLANSPKTADEYEAKLILEVVDATPAKMKALIAGLKITLFPMPVKIQQSGSSRIVITDIALSKRALSGVITK